MRNPGFFWRALSWILLLVKNPGLVGTIESQVQVLQKPEHLEMYFITVSYHK